MTDITRQLMLTSKFAKYHPYFKQERDIQPITDPTLPDEVRRELLYREYMFGLHIGFEKRIQAQNEYTKLVAI